MDLCTCCVYVFISLSAWESVRRIDHSGFFLLFLIAPVYVCLLLVRVLPAASIWDHSFFF